MVDPSEFAAWLVAWVVVMAIVLWGQQREGSGSGLVLSYVLQLWLLHWLAASIYALPWYASPTKEMLDGLKESTYAIAGFALGSTVIVPMIVLDRGLLATTTREWAEADPWLVHTYLGIGAVMFFVLEPILHSIATIGAIASATSNLLLVALGMECWNGLRGAGRNGRSFWRWVFVTAMLPFVTIATKGFLGYGFAAMITVFAFVASFYRPRWKMVVASLVVAFFALSLYVTYMRDRVGIREVVWGQESYAARVSTIAKTLTNFELIDLTNVDHLKRIDERMNQNFLVGLAVDHLTKYPDQFANGATIWQALLAPVPRMFWPEKVAAAGSGDMVSEFTGMRFSDTTSVGIGHVMEWYVNFGSAGVFFGMVIVGVIIAWLDRRAVLSLAQGDWAHFVFWWLPGLSLLQVGGSFFEALSGAASALVVVLVIGRFRPARLRKPKAGAPAAFAAEGAPPALDATAARRLAPSAPAGRGRSRPFQTRRT